MTVLNVEVAGNVDGPPMVLIHGFLSCNAQWMANRDALGRRHRLFLVELPGHGNSPRPDSTDGYGPAAVIPAIDAVRVDHGVDRWWVVGQSLGGAVAARYALAHPDRTLGLAFTNSRAMFGIPRRQSSGSEKRLPPPTITHPRDLAVHPINATRFPEEVKSALVAGADAIDLSVIDAITAHRNSWRSVDDFSDFSFPTLLVNGRWEKAFQPHVPHAVETIPDLTLVELEGGHSINIEQAAAFNEAVLAFTA